MFKLPALPFDATALEPSMSSTTLQTHHGKHHAGYVKKTNELLAETSAAPTELEEVVRRAARDKETSLFNNSAQAWNHGFFWNCLSPQQQTEPEGDLKRAIEKSFESIDGFREEAHRQGVGHFASGWLWLVASSDGSVALHDLHDAQTPIVEQGVTPLLVCDLWEHAYYLDYKNDRGSFLSTFLNRLANWRFAERQFDAATSRNGAWRYPD
jgi:Fe-Mn family superoxide dismutase